MEEEKRKPGRPKVNNAGEQELIKCGEQFDKFDAEVKSMTLDRMNQAPKEELEPQTKLSSRELSNVKELYLKPKRAIPSKEPFNEKWRASYDFDKEYVHFTAENKEIIGETINLWTKPYPGLPAEEWEIPVNKPLWAPRYLAEQLKRKLYHRLVMQENRATHSDGMGQYYGSMAVDTTIQRLDAIPVSTRKSVFLGASGF
jgi:hypothetical protein